MTEQNLQTMLGWWFDITPQSGTIAVELKICKADALPFNRVADHQVKALLRVKTRGLYHKIQDSPVSWGKDSRMRFTKRKPFDCVYIKGEAYVVIGFYKPRQPKVFCFIDIEDFVRERDSSRRKSLTLERARAISSNVIAL